MSPSSIFMWKVSPTTKTAALSIASRKRMASAIVTHTHVVLITVERLDEDPRAGALRALRERPQALEEERLVFIARTTGREARQIASASPDRNDDDPRPKL